MAKRKFYAVKIGKVPGIYQTWAECKNQTDGISGAEYKSFSTLEEAEQYLQTPSHTISSDELSVTDLNAQIEERISSLGDREIVAFVDGSYDDTQKNLHLVSFCFPAMEEKRFSIKPLLSIWAKSSFLLEMLPLNWKVSKKLFAGL